MIYLKAELINLLGVNNLFWDAFHFALLDFTF